MSSGTEYILDTITFLPHVPGLTVKRFTIKPILNKQN